jgi:hypothetical protein
MGAFDSLTLDALMPFVLTAIPQAIAFLVWASKLSARVQAIEDQLATRLGRIESLIDKGLRIKLDANA